MLIFGYIIYSYQLPLALESEQVITAAVGRLKTLRPCYETIKESKFSALLRCDHPERSQRFYGIQEYGYRLAPQKKRLYVMGIIDVPANPQRHEEFLQALEDFANRQSK